MRRAVLAIVSTVTGLVMLLSFKTHTAISTTATAVPPAATSSSSSSSTASKTVSGDSVGTRWGPVQVQITVAGGKVTAAQAVVYPQENPRDQEINAYAVPILNQEAVDASSAGIDMVSGATVTSEGYLTSLQSALDKANA